MILWYEVIYINLVHIVHLTKVFIPGMILKSGVKLLIYLQLEHFSVHMEKITMLLLGFMGNMDDVVTYYNAHLNKYIVSWKVIPKYTPSS